MPLPLIGEVIDKLKKARYFNKLDLIWRYNNVQIKKEDEWKAVFLTNKGLFKPQLMYFGFMQLPWNISTDDKQYIPRIVT